MRRRYRSLPLQRPHAQPDQGLDAERSAEACPACGRHTVSLLGFPYVATMGAQPTADILGMGELSADQPPAIACLSCGAQWPDVAAFRQARGPGRGSA
ncbi:MAG: hypothetical protein M3452_06825 [Chloroflexota bacterium]|nr:hypothetical protein [Chloroflexota bacterium]